MSSTELPKLQIAGIVNDSIVDGEGIRLTVFTQGCPRRCLGCHNPATQPLTGGHFIDVTEVIELMDKNPLLTGVTLSGGEPFIQPEPLTLIARAAHERLLDVWSYSGYTLEELQALKNPAVDELLAEVDILVDGEYIESQRDLTLSFRGSRNQRVIDLKESRRKGSLILKYADEVN